MDWEILRWVVNVIGSHRVTANVSKAFLLGLVLFFVIYCLERYYGAPTRQYRSRQFFHDALYWLWTGGGLNRLVLTSVILSFMSDKLSVLKMDPLHGLPTVPRYIVYWIVVDLLAYSIHRWRHASRFMWAFHTTHHAQEKLSFATVLRIHPVEFAITDLVMFVPLLVLGAPPQSWLSIYYLRVFMEAIQHSHLPWRFGPLYYVFVSPMFHSCHHSVSPEHHDRNFGVTLSVWDFLFGTAVTAEQRPARYGLEALTMPTLASSLIAPFHVLRQTYWSGTDRRTAEARKVPAS
jgi:Sterol desaturase